MRRYNVLIVEDERLAQANLKRALERDFDDINIVGTLDSVSSTVEWLKREENHADIIFMDVELSDGMCFDIFSQVEVRSKVVITTAFDNYAVKAFRINSIDYLLKPINSEELAAALARCRELISASSEPTGTTFNIDSLREIFSADTTTYKKRFIVKYGDRLTIIETKQIAYFYVEDKSTYLVTNENRRYILDSSLDTISEQVNPDTFFRISRHCTLSIEAITGISKHPSNRLKVTLSPKPDFEVFVSRSRTTDFMEWLEGK